MTSVEERLDALQAQVQELQDVRAIEALVARYHTLCDGGWDKQSHDDVEGLVELWMPNGTYCINEAKPPCRGHDEIRAQFLRLRESMPWILHTFMNPVIDVTGDTATGTCKAAAYYRRQGGAHIVVGSYNGEFVRTEAGWRFASWVADLAHGSVLSPEPFRERA
jgi:hypothetical protein